MESFKEEGKEVLHYNNKHYKQLLLPWLVGGGNNFHFGIK